MSGPIVITGANGAIGQAIVRQAGTDGIRFVAAVRSERAESQLPAIPAGIGRVARISYDAPETLAAACAGAAALIHLPGLLIERPGSGYEQSNIETTRAACAAVQAAGVTKVVLVSACGADANSRNRFLCTKGVAEELVSCCGAEYTILRAPLVLGPGTEGTRAALRYASGSQARLLGGGRQMQQPLDVQDLAQAALAACNPGVAKNRILDIAGPERLEDREIILRLARLQGREIRIASIPVAPVRWLLKLRQRFAGPGFSSDALEVILADTNVDAETSARELGIRLTPLEATLRRSLEGET